MHVLQSYAGKYLPAIGYKIHTENMGQPKLKINLKGLIIGDGLCDPENVRNRSNINIYSVVMYVQQWLLRVETLASLQGVDLF